jgi:hypothetical protein
MRCCWTRTPSALPSIVSLQEQLTKHLATANLNSLPGSLTSVLSGNAKA